MRTSQPYWLMRDGIGDARSSARLAPDYDIVIIGAGITGALVADSLVATGRRIVMLDSREPAQGSTSASTALLQYEIDEHLLDLAKKLGPERATLAYRAGVSCFATLEQRFPDLLAQSGYQRRPSLYLASEQKDVAVLRAECAARTGIGIHCEWLEGEDVVRRFGAHRPAAILSSPGAQIDPVRFTRGVLAGCERHGVEIRTREPVARIEEAGEKLRVLLKSGGSLLAGDVIVCAGYESLQFLPDGVADLHNTFALVTEPLPPAENVASLPLIWESARPYLYLRGTPDGRLMVGGADVPLKNAAARDVLLPRQIRRVAAGYQDLFQRELPPIAYAWAGSFAETRDGLPYIGAVPGLHPRLRFALCYGGNGISYAIQAGEILRAGVEGRAHALGELYGFGRLGTDLATGRQRGVAGD
ncbi:MAG TPA: FAD-dependent oxidoreductase [Steroidobacteraceae bacterium]|nr:FAD-dependent oxidoreductase [Steroidobacteraceae bacterium]